MQCFLSWENQSWFSSPYNTDFLHQVKGSKLK